MSTTELGESRFVERGWNHSRPSTPTWAIDHQQISPLTASTTMATTSLAMCDGLLRLSKPTTSDEDDIGSFAAEAITIGMSSLEVGGDVAPATIFRPGNTNTHDYLPYQLDSAIIKRMQKTTVTLVDDLDGSEATETVSFSLSGRDYEIDLSDKNKAALEKALEKYISGARRAGTKVARKSTASGRSDLDAIRTWARGQGLKVSDRGRVAASIIEAYDKAN